MLDLMELKWTKNIKDPDKWAYKDIPLIYPDLKIFTLAWRNFENKDIENAKAPKEGDQIILRQKGKVTHIVQLLNNQLYFDKYATNEFSIYRLVNVVWMADFLNNPPDNEEVFGCHINFPANGKVISLANIQQFQNRWGEGGLTEFQQHISKVLS
ncbi:hypothetical protein [Nodularia sp. UHCC 0506]|uniref:hypothetical protein n=1 Tax=Nodularia sp. UHCC 0506 TaxID=3110243 RepID=UPI002B1F9F36|nr:hypothetical protein [Nodularia sp. UHCC 0506]MEA5514177.1 hypothetical protein [Nodularia sp. UHCC 0506]